MTQILLLLGGLHPRNSRINSSSLAVPTLQPQRHTRESRSPLHRVHCSRRSAIPAKSAPMAQVQGPSRNQDARMTPHARDPKTVWPNFSKDLNAMALAGRRGVKLQLHLGLRTPCPIPITATGARYPTRAIGIHTRKGKHREQSTSLVQTFLLTAERDSWIYLGKQLINYLSTRPGGMREAITINTKSQFWQWFLDTCEKLEKMKPGDHGTGSA